MTGSADGRKKATTHRAEDRKLARLTKICLALVGATREVNGDHATFRVKKRPFAYFLADHHGDGIVAVCAKVAPGATPK